MINFQSYVDSYNKQRRTLEKRFMPSKNQSYDFSNFHFVCVCKGNKSFRYFDNDTSEAINIDAQIPFSSQFALILEARKQKGEILRIRQGATVGFRLLEEESSIGISYIQRGEKRYIENKGVFANLALVGDLIYFAQNANLLRVVLSLDEISGIGIEEQGQLQGRRVQDTMEKIERLYYQVIRGFNFRNYGNSRYVLEL